MKKKKLLCIVMAAVTVFSSVGCSKKNNDSKVKFKDGNIKDNSSDFLDPKEQDMESPVASSYYENITYKVKKTDTENEIIVLELSVPDFPAILNQVIEKNMEENKDADYETLLESVKEDLIMEINNPKHQVISTELEMDIAKNENGDWKIVPNEAFYSAIAEPVINSMEAEKNEKLK